DVRMLELRDGARLPLEPLDEVFVLVVLLVQDLQRHIAFEQRVMSLVDGRHPAVADDLLEAVSPCDRLSDHHARKLPARRPAYAWDQCARAFLRRVPSHRPPHQRRYRRATSAARNQAGTRWWPCPSWARPTTRATAHVQARTPPRAMMTRGLPVPVAPTASGSANASTEMRYPATARVSARWPTNVNLCLGQGRAERVFPDAERLVELALRDDERDEHADAVRVDPRLQQKQPSCRGGVDDRRRELRSRVLGAAVVDELDREHRTEPADVADCIPALLPG